LKERSRTIFFMGVEDCGKLQHRTAGHDCTTPA
jgi:hypothetical protein